MTNFERIKSMSKEEFAKWWDDVVDCEFCPNLSKCNCFNCEKQVGEWLEEEVK